MAVELDQLTWQTKPANLQNTADATLTVQTNRSASLISKAGTLLESSPVQGSPDLVQLPLTWLSLFLAFFTEFSRGDANLNAIFPLRGTWDLDWALAALNKLITLGFFDDDAGRMFASREDLFIQAHNFVRDLHAFPAEFVITEHAWDDNSLGLVPGHFGPAANQPWSMSLTFGHAIMHGGSEALCVFQFVHDLGGRYTRAQITPLFSHFRTVSSKYAEGICLYLGASGGGAR